MQNSNTVRLYLERSIDYTRGKSKLDGANFSSNSIVACQQKTLVFVWDKRDRLIRTNGMSALIAIRILLKEQAN